MTTTSAATSIVANVYVTTKINTLSAAATTRSSMTSLKEAPSPLKFILEGVLLELLDKSNGDGDSLKQICNMDIQ